MANQAKHADSKASWAKFSNSMSKILTHPVPFQCSGTIKLDEPLTLLAKVGDKVIGLDFPLPSEGAADTLKPMIDLCEPAVFGRGKENVLDPTYRDALVLPTKTVGLVSPSFSLIPILNIVEKLLLTSHEQLESKKIKAVFEKCNVYGKGGFFGSHADTPRGEGMFASLVLILPSHFSGGELILRKRSPRQSGSASDTQESENSGPSVDVEEYSFGCGDPTQLKWVAFFSDIEHEIKPVADGSRITVTYNLFNEEVVLPIPLLTTPVDTMATVPIYDILVNSLKDPNFLPQGHEIGIYCTNTYVIETDATAHAAISHLRGIDLWVYKGLKHLASEGVSNITFTMNFVVSPEDDEDIVLPAKTPLDRFEDWTFDEYHGNIYTRQGGRRVSGNPHRPIDSDEEEDYEDHYEEEEAEGEAISDEDNGQPKKKKPTTGSLERANLKSIWTLNGSSRSLKMPHMQYGNEYSVGYEYASIMFLINIPPFDIRFN
ncbi:hypothetical protein FRC03_002602 [Tulasnella sp. 419]|nr:hypothetical protein FRC03_002602 [Tulasnella sp. 419]